MSIKDNVDQFDMTSFAIAIGLYVASMSPVLLVIYLLAVS